MSNVACDSAIKVIFHIYFTYLNNKYKNHYMEIFYLKLSICFSILLLSCYLLFLLRTLIIVGELTAILLDHFALKCSLAMIVDGYS